MEQNKKLDTIFVGSKPLMNYVTGIMIQLNTGNLKGVIIKSRGKFTSKAIDVVELTKRKFTKEGVKSNGIIIGSEEFQTPEGKKITVSTLEITLTKD
jgi:archaea-specific DNA-binding protein